MTPLDFLRRILPPLENGAFGPSGCYFTLALGTGKPVQTPCTTFDRVAEACQLQSGAGKDAYMALASFTDSAGGRRQANVLKLKAFRCDIDAGKRGSDGSLKPGVYEDAKTALAALAEFVKQTRLAPSVVVSSGMGLHVYWTLDAAIPASLWMPLAARLLRLFQNHNLLVDSPKTTDTAAVLRLPGTRHQKTGNVVTVLAAAADDYTLDSFTAMLPDAASPAVPAVPVMPALPASDDGFNHPSPRKTGIENVVANCRQVSTMGHGSYDQWFYSMSVLRRFEHGLEWAHKLSAMDAERYDPATTERRFMQASEDAPVLCATLERVNPAACSACPYRGMVKTPAQLNHAQQAKPAEPKPVPSAAELSGHLIIPSEFHYERVPFASDQFSVDNRGIIYHKSEKTAGGWEVRDVVICASQLYFKHGVYQYVNERPTRSYIFDAVHPNGRVESLRLDVDTDLAAEPIRKWFANANMYPTAAAGSQAGALFLKFMNAYLSSVVHLNASKEVPTFEQFGWTKFADPENKAITHTGFVTGSGVITHKGVMDARLDERIASYGKKELGHKGTLEEWKRGIDIYKTLNQMLAQYTVLLSFAAPFMKEGIGEAQAAVMSIWSSQSGMGKSHVLRFAASVWGDPTQAFVSRMASVSLRGFKLGKFQNLPVFFDEMTDVSDNDMYGLAYTLTGGKEKDKMHSSGGQRIETGNWSTVSFTTANKSFKSVIARKAGDSDATIRRIMEYECDFKDYSDYPSVTRYIDDCINTVENNYGVAGPELIYRVLQNEGRIGTIHPLAVKWVTDHKFSNDERYLSSPSAIALIIGRWCVEWGLLDWDIDAIEKWVLEEFIPYNRKFTSEYAPNFADIMGNYLTDRQPFTLVVAGASRKENEPPVEAKGLPDRYIRFLPQREIYARYEMRERRLIVSRRDLGDWCRKQNIALSTVTARLASEGIECTETTRRLGGHIPWMSDAKMRCYTFEKDALDKLGISMEDDYGSTEEK